MRHIELEHTQGMLHDAMIGKKDGSEELGDVLISQSLQRDFKAYSIEIAMCYSHSNSIVNDIIAGGI